MPSNASQSYTTVIDLTSKAQRKRRREEVGELQEPDPPLDPLTPDTVPPIIEQVLHAAGWMELMDVQNRAIPYILDGRDIIVQSRTGSGKTGAFLLPLFSVLNPKKRQQQALILTPTRELARQVHEEFERMKLATPDTHEMDAALIYGGVGYGPQIKALKNGAHVVIGTPGRVLDLLKKKKIRTRHMCMLILDEADEMLSMGFYPDMQDIIERLPDDRQSYMFSATMPPKVRSVAREFLDAPGYLSLSEENMGVDEISYRYYLANPMDKDRTLLRLLELEDPESALIFANTKREVSYLKQFLDNQGYRIDEMSGDLSQSKREAAIDRLRSGEMRILVATDVAARGIDVSDLSHVFIYDVPQDQEALIHRSGRTARAGKTGTTIVLATHEDEFELLRMAKQYDISIERDALPEDPFEVATDLLNDHVRALSVDADLVDEFRPLAKKLASEDPDLFASLLAAMYAEHKEAEDPSS